MRHGNDQHNGPKFERLRGRGMEGPVGSKITYYFFPKKPWIRVLIVAVGGALTVFLDFYSHGIPGFLESVDPISAYLIRGLICVLAGMFLVLVLSFFFNLITRIFKNGLF